MIEDLIIVLFSAVVVSGLIGGVIGWSLMLREIVRVSNERDELRGLINAAGVDFDNIKAASEKLLIDAAAISDAAAKMIAISRAAESGAQLAI